MLDIRTWLTNGWQYIAAVMIPTLIVIAFIGMFWFWVTVAAVILLVGYIYLADESEACKIVIWALALALIIYVPIHWLYNKWPKISHDYYVIAEGNKKISEDHPFKYELGKDEHIDLKCGKKDSIEVIDAAGNKFYKYGFKKFFADPSNKDGVKQLAEGPLQVYPFSFKKNKKVKLEYFAYNKYDKEDVRKLKKKHN